jgi:hypothetical protein
MQLSHLASSLATTKGLFEAEFKGESPEKAVAGMASAKNNPSVSTAFLMFIVLTLVFL